MKNEKHTTPPKPDRMVPKMVSMPLSALEALEDLGRDTGKSAAHHARQAIKAYLEAQSAQAPGRVGGR